MHPKTREKLILTVVGWLVAGADLLPDLLDDPDQLQDRDRGGRDAARRCSSTPTLENYATVRERADYIHFALNSIIISVGATLLATLIAVPAAYAMAFFPGKRTKDLLLWMLSTKMMPAVGVLIPIYLLFRDLGALDTRWGLIIVYTLMNLPIVVWMLYTFFKEVPKDILEAGRMDGAKPKQEVWMLLLPLSLPGIASTAPAVDHPVLERGVLEPQPDHLERGAADHLHRLVLRTRGAVLGQALGRLDDRDRPHPRLRLDEPAPARARPDLRRRQVIGRIQRWRHCHAQGHPQELRRRRRSSRASTSRSRTASSASSSARPAAASRRCCG